MGEGKTRKITIKKGTSLSIKVVFIRYIGIQETPVAMTIIEGKVQEGLDPDLMRGRAVVIAEIERPAPHPGKSPVLRRET
jgi:hypothetical protein